MHWTFRDDKTRAPQPDEYFGFVYVISNKLTTKQYIGCKQYWQMRKRKRHKPSNWRVYTSSSKDLNEDIDKIGKRRFKFEIIQEYKTKRGLHYYEQFYQMKHHVLTAVIEGSDEPAYYNKNIGGIRFYVPLEKWEDPEWLKERYQNSEYKQKIIAAMNKPETKKKLSEASKARWADPEYRKKQINSNRSQTVSKAMRKGPYRITFDTGKEIIIDNLNVWSEEKNYDSSTLFKVLIKKRKSHKDIVKVERLSDEEEK